MPRTHLLDTCVYSQPIKRAEKQNQGAIARWKALGDDSLAVSAICEAEVLFGLAKNGSPRMRQLYESILRGRLPILAIDTDVAAAYAVLRADCERHGSTVADMDLLVAATAVANGLTVATLNVKHFAQINGISIEDWSLARSATHSQNDS